MHAELAHFIARRRDDAAVAAATDDDGLAAQLGSVALLDGRVERVHVHVQDRAAVQGVRSGRRLQRQRRVEQQADGGQRHEAQVTDAEQRKLRRA